MNNFVDKPTILCPCPAPKRLLTSNNWISRNDSSNVSSILHPNNYLFSPRLKYNEKTKGDVMVKQIMSNNNCYCRCKSKTLPKPTYFKRPNSCVSYREISPNEIVDKGDFKRKSMICVCKDVDKAENVGSDPTLHLSRLRQATISLPKEVGLKPTEQRMKYEEFRQIQEEKFQEKLLKDEEQEKLAKLNEQFNSNDCFITDGVGAKESSNINTILGTQKYEPTSGSLFSNTRLSSNDYYDFKKRSDQVYPQDPVANFRQEHYFETHDIGKLAGITGNSSKDDHTCVHQFQLDDRWLPEPLNKDSFGRSICKICDKVMDGSRINLSSGYFFSGCDLSRSKIKNYAESYKTGFSPTTINLGKGKSKIEVIVKDMDIEKFGNYVNRAKKPVYYNSLALRHQRLRMI